MNLAPVEKVLLTLAKAQLERGDQIDPHIAAVLVRTLARIHDASDAFSCTCYPGGVTPSMYEGPQEWCDVHGLPSAAYALGLRTGRIDGDQP